MTRVILNGCYGRMGKTLTTLIASQQNVEVVAGIDLNQGDAPFAVFSSLSECNIAADVVIDFSTPQSLHSYIPSAVEKNLAVVVATTGLEEKELTLLEEASSKIAIFRSGNMSLGINLLEKVVATAAKVLADSFDIEIVEKHHNQKQDSPSGTAMMLADSVNEALNNSLNYTFGRHGLKTKREKGELGIHAVRGGTIVGEHEVIFAGEDEVISFSHRAFSRNVFATGAIAAAKYIATVAPGIYNMSDMLALI
ncbi:MAG: 4-hydroxy-tetrahydrodipicolinate reductase [Candidatus Cloacimonetes bacterium]|jgi:4-hydroxy-tetrahydrodipicolinate reductase|nr:4-hydroxy-tetrahydrodipicolinate reductase [Candidatus Cloacimonadota bacterium]